MSVGIEPMGEMVLLEMENAPEKTESGLLLPEEAREKMNVGKVVAIGPDVEGLNLDDRVIYRQYSGTKVEWARNRIHVNKIRRSSSEGTGPLNKRS